MNIIGNEIEFKSTEENYLKERDNRKCNTVRRFRLWAEMKAFEQFRGEFTANTPNKSIKISCGKLGYFTRTITDITPFEGYFIISW